jgi:outer membrane protein, heavy metal efflux system
VGVSWAIGGLLAAIAHGQPSGVTTLADALARAMTANPRLIAARLGRAVALEGIAVARERPNPELTFEATRDAPHESVSTAWTIETGGKRARRIDVARAGAQRVDAELARLTADVRLEVRRAYAALLAARQRTAVTSGLRALAARARDAARDRFESGAAPRLEAVQAALALAEAENEAEAAAGLTDAARSELNALIGAPPDAPLVPTDNIGLPPLPTPDAALASALNGNADLAVIDRQIAEAQARVGLARAMQKPDTIADTGVTFDAQPEFNYGWRVGAILTLPILTRHRAGVRVEEAALVQLRAERDASVARIRGAVAASLARASAQTQAYARYRDQILPDVDEVERMAEDSYRSGQTGLVTLLQAMQSTRDTRLRAVQAASDLQAALADLEQAIGVALP